jgi:hypothetical protein
MSSMSKPLRAAASTLLLIAATTACGSLHDATETADTVDQAVNLLHEIDENGTWKQISDGLRNLNEQKQSFSVTVHLREGIAGATGNSEDPPGQEVTMTVQVDAGHNALLHVIAMGQTRDYLVEGYRDVTDSTRIYQVENGHYSCVEGGDDRQWLQNGLAGVFDQYAVTATGVQLLTVTEKIGDEPVASRSATHYRLESRVPDALAILKKIDNTELQQTVDAAGKFQLTGDLFVDKDTQALLRFVSTYDDLDAARRTEFSFEVTQWGGIPDIPGPADAQIAVACN